MELTIFKLLGIYFVAGGFAVWKISMRNPEIKSDLLKKFWFYALIVFSLCSILTFSCYFPAIAMLLAAGGLSELIYAWYRSNKKKFRPLVIAFSIFSLVTFFFLYGSILFDGLFVLKVYVTVLTFDGFSQLSGQLFGKTKMCPGISPSKTWEGFAGGFIVGLLTAAWLFHEANFSYSQFFLPLVIPFTSFIGDLLASLYKRKCGVKDYSKLIPGHGGLLDRFDSFIFSLAAVTLISLIACNI